MKETQHLTTHETDKKVNRIRISNSPQAYELTQYIGHETVICYNPPIHNFTGDRKNLPDP